MPTAVRGLAYCEPVVGEREWSDFPDPRRSYFQSLRGAEGERLVLEENIFGEAIPRSV
jgi:haloalkane dehalogenase